MRKLLKAARAAFESFSEALRGPQTAENPSQVSEVPILEVVLQGRSGPLYGKYLIRGVIGNRLVGIPVDGSGSGERLISQREAVDPRKFQKFFKMSVPKETKMVWEDTRQEVTDFQA